MEWTKIPTDLLQSRKSDKEILAITKYQLLWAMLERRPDDQIALRYMTTNQLRQAYDYITAIQQRIDADIKSVSSHRNRQKIYYEKNQTLNEKCDGHTDGHTDSHTDGHTDAADKIREEENIESPYNPPRDKASGLFGTNPLPNPLAESNNAGGLSGDDLVHNPPADSKKTLQRYGEFKNVCLDEDKYNALTIRYGKDKLSYAIEKLDTWLDKDKQKKERNHNHRGYFKENSWVWEGYVHKVDTSDDVIRSEVL